MACTSTSTRPAPITEWTQQGVGINASSPASRKTLLWTRTEKINVATVNLIGRAEQIVNNSGGGATMSKGWRSIIKRYGQSMFVANNGSPYVKASFGVGGMALLDPALPTQPILIRARDVVHAERVAGVLNPSVAFVIAHSYPWQYATLEAVRGVGFHSYGSGTWKCYVSGNNMQNIRAFETGKPITDVCELMFEIDGSLRQIRWYINGVQVDEYNAVADATAMHVATEQQIVWSLKAPAGAGEQWTYSHGLGIGGIVEMEVLA